MIRNMRIRRAVAQPAHVLQRRYLTSGRPRLSHTSPPRLSLSHPTHQPWQSTSALTNESAASPASASQPSQAPSYLFRPFMGHSSAFAALPTPLQRADITQLEREPLTHVTPGRVNDHLCIAMVKTLRWIADRAFRERYIHRATMLVTVAAAAPAAGSVAAYVRMLFKRCPTGTAGHGSAAAEADSPFMAAGTAGGVAAASSSAAAAAAHTARDGRLRHATPVSAVSGAALQHSYVDELRGLLAQSENHAVHYQILSSMAEITAVERGLVLLLQALHFAIYLFLFLFYPRMGFRLMAYTAEESSVVWTQMVNDIDLGKIAELRVPRLALHYWGLEGSFVAQGALVPMVVAPKPHDVVVFATEETNVSINVDDSAGGEPRPHTAAGQAHSEHASASTRQREPSAVTPSVSEAAAAAGEPTQAKDGEKATTVTTKKAATTDGDNAAEKPTLTLRDVVLLVRSDEMLYRDLNHEMATELDRQPGFLQRMLDRYDSR